MDVNTTHATNIGLEMRTRTIEAKKPADSVSQRTETSN